MEISYLVSYENKIHLFENMHLKFNYLKLLLFNMLLIIFYVKIDNNILNSNLY